MAAETSQATKVTPKPLVWQVASNADLLWHVWDDETVVYHRRSGDTHILNPLSAVVLEFLDQRAATCSQIVEHVADYFELKADDELLQKMEECLSRFDQVGLIETAHVSE